MTEEIRENIYQVNNLNLHVVESGPETGKVIIFLHGFPEFWYGWHKQLAYFAAAGFRVIIPDQRGYNLSSKPKGVKSYILANLISDIAQLIKQLTDQKIYVVGHDWGGVVAWTLADKFPQLIDKLIVLNIPHPHVMTANLKRNPKQMLKSWYAGFFQIPFLPEVACRAFNFKILAQSMVKSAKKRTFSAQDIAQYKTAWAKSGALTAMLNWYRAYKYNSIAFSSAIQVPTLLIWGKKDAFLGFEMAAQSISKCLIGKLKVLDDATHWLHHEKPDEVNTLIHEFIK